MTTTVVVTDANLARVAADLERGLDGVAELVWALDPDTRLAALADADVLVGPAFTPAMAAAAPKLKLVQVGGAGTDAIEPDAVAEHGRLYPSVEGRPLAVANTYYHEAAMAEYAIWAAVGLRRDLAAVDAALRQGEWRSPVYDRDLPLPPGLKGATVVLFGFGHVGEAAWKAFQALGASGIAITGSGRTDAVAHGLEWAGASDRLVEAARQADILLVSVPLGDATRGVVGAEVLDALGPSGVVINIARGPVVDQAALYERLADRRVGGAALDVWYDYPAGPGQRQQPAASDFGSLPNVLLTPHISGVALQTFQGRAADIAANVKALIEGRPLRNPVSL